MILEVDFKEQSEELYVDFKAETAISDGGFERGYESGYIEGEKNGYSSGYEGGYEVGFNDAKAMADTIVEDLSRKMCFKQPWGLKIPADVTSIYSQALQYSSVGEDIDLNNVVTAGPKAFYRCEKIKNIRGEKVETLETQAICDCDALESAYFPMAKTLGANCFQYDRKLVVAEFSAESIDASCFSACSVLTKLILRGNKVCTLKNTNAFSSSGIYNKTGYVYVPDNLVNSYKTATNWSTYADQIKPLSELEA